jgi:hypothetical protein
VATQDPPLFEPKGSLAELWRRLAETLIRMLGAWTTPAPPQQQLPTIAPASYELAVAQANERRRRLTEVLGEAGRDGVLRREFLEIPPEMDGFELRSLANYRGEAFAQMARLRWQMGAHERLLIERLVDAVVIFQRQAGSVRWSNIPRALAVEDPLVRLHRDKSLERKGLFPWKAIIETEAPQVYMRVLAPIRDWLAIGVEFAPKSRPRLLAKCQEADGEPGSVGGLVEAEKTYKMTCAHVLAPGCQSVELRSFPDSNNKDVPDVALLPVSAHCFQLPAPVPKRALSCATNDTVRECIDDGTKVIKINGLHGGCPGLVYEQVSVLPAATYGKSVRFPHLKIKPNTKTYLFGLLTLPLGRHKFSEQGDSGSWAVESKGGSWLGMVVANSDEGTYIVEAAPLLDYLEDELNARNQSNSRIKLIPFTYSDGRT